MNDYFFKIIPYTGKLFTNNQCSLFFNNHNSSMVFSKGTPISQGRQNYHGLWEMVNPNHKEQH